MTIDTRWTLSADITAQHTDSDGNTYPNVVRLVRWRCFASDGDEEVSVYGTKGLPLPSNPATYIDLSVITDQTAEQRHATILGWAEMVDPGFVEKTENKVIEQLRATLETPSTTSIQIL